MKRLLFIIALFISSIGFAQKIKITEGKLSALKGVKVITTEFSYDDMKVGKDGELAEADYIKRKKEEYDKKEPGRGDKFEKAWYDDRKARFEPQFNELFEKFAAVSTRGTSKYTLLFKTTRTEPGWNVGVMRAPARIFAEAVIYETGNPANVICKITIDKAPGRDAMGYDFESGARIQEAYAKSGKELGKMVADAK